MSEEHNPYDPPQNNLPPDGSRQPTPFATFVIGLLTLAAAGVAFFVTCFGTGLVLYGLLYDAALLIAVIAGLIAAGAVASWVGKFLVRTYSR